MPIDPDAVGAVTGPFESSWSHHDCILYALTVGACMDDPLGVELAYVTDNTADVELQALPTMCSVLGGVLDTPSPLTMIGDYDRRKSVHGSVEIVLERPLPPEGSVTSTVAVDGIYDKGKAALVSLVIAAEDSTSGDRLFQVRNGIFIRDEGGWGGDPGPPWHAGAVPERSPEASVVQTPRAEQPLFYQLNGDRNPLHTDPAAAIRAGFERPIMHGMCTFGFVGRAVIQAMCGGDPDRIAGMGCRFGGPALPGEAIETDMWLNDEQVVFQTRSQGRTVLSGGYVTLRSI